MRRHISASGLPVRPFPARFFLDMIDEVTRFLPVTFFFFVVTLRLVFALGMTFLRM
jgi:hypothetical protein